MTGMYTLSLVLLQRLSATVNRDWPWRYVWQLCIDTRTGNRDGGDTSGADHMVCNAASGWVGKLPRATRVLYPGKDRPH